MDMQKVRTTTYLDRELINLAKKEALLRGSSLSELLSQGLKSELNIPRTKKKLRMGRFSLGEYKFKREDAYE